MLRSKRISPRLLQVFGNQYEFLGYLETPELVMRPSGLFLEQRTGILAINAYWANAALLYRFRV